MFSSLVTRLTLAVLAVLLLSLGLTTGFFVYQSNDADRLAATSSLSQNTVAGSKQVFKILLNTVSGRLPSLNHAGIQGVDRVLLTLWDGDVVVGPEPHPPTLRITYHGQRPAMGDLPIGDTDYRYVALPIVLPEALASTRPDLFKYHSILMLKQVKTWQQRTWDVVRQLAVPGIIGVIISALAALVALRAITRPIHSITEASERMAAGDYDQRVAGADSSDEVGQLARSFNRMASEVKRVREMQRQFIANVSHDLRSPLTSIIGFSEALAEDGGVAPMQRRAAEIIHGEAQRLLRLTMDLLDLSRLEAGRLPLSRQPLDLNAALHEIAARYHALPNQRGVRFAEELYDGVLPILADPDRLTQIMVNLLDNATKFCNPNGEVTLRSSRDGTMAIVEVYNTGTGIAPEDLPRVFNRFYRGDHSRAQQTGGSGVGLAIVRELVVAHGGEVVASSELGKSVTMAVRLPLADDSVFTKDLHKANIGATDYAYSDK